MKSIENVKNSFQIIYSHKMRSLLTLLGIIIGVMAVVTIFSSIYSIKNYINDKIEQMGWNNVLLVTPGANDNRQNFRYRYRRRSNLLTYDDFKFVRKEVESKYAYSFIEDWEWFNSEKKGWVQVRGVNNDYFESKSYNLLKGSLFNAFQIKKSVKVCVIGYFFKEKHFPNKNPIGEELKVGKFTYKIIGILDKDKVNSNAFNFNNWERKRDLRAVYIPTTTASRNFRNGNSIDYFSIQAENEEKFSFLQNKINQLMLIRHNMNHDFSFQDVGAKMVEITSKMNELMKKWNITLFVIASISLLVGGVGLFSILLISINERMMEIGIRKSIGATSFDIFLYFLFESVLLSLIGAFCGISVATLLIKLVSSLIKIDFTIPLIGITIGISFSIIIGFLSGLYPAIKASKIDPIKAIFYND